MILKLKDKAWNGARQDLRDTTNFDFRSQENKAMSVTVFDSQELIHKEFVPPGQTANKDNYVKVLSRLVQRSHRVTLQFQERGN